MYAQAAVEEWSPKNGDGSRTSVAAKKALQEVLARLHGPESGGEHVTEQTRLNRCARQRRYYGKRLSFHIPFAFLVLFLFAWHYRRNTAYEFTKTVADSLSRPSLQATNFTNSTWAWLSNRAEKPFVVPHAMTIGGARLRWLLEATGDVKKDDEAEDKENEEVLCDYSKINFFWDAIRGALRSDAKPRICHMHQSGVYWVHWPLYRSSTLFSTWLTTGATAGGATLQVLAKSQQVDFYVLYKARVRFDASGLFNVEVSSSAFNSKPLWADPGGSFEKVIVMIFDIIFLCVTCCRVAFQFVELYIIIKGCVKEKRSFGPEFFISRLITSMAVCIIVMYAYCEHLTRGLNQLVSSIPVVAEDQRYTLAVFIQDVLGSQQTLQQYEQILDACLEQSLRIVDCLTELYWYVGIAVVCIVIQILQSLHAFRQCSVFMRSLGTAVHDVCHLAVAALTLLALFVVIGHAIYGARIEHFSTFGLSLEATFLVLQGNYDNKHQMEMRDEAGALGVMWIWFLQLFFSLAILYVILAVLFDRYRASRVENLAHGPQLHFACTGAERTDHQQNISLCDSIRLCGRIDANMRDLDVRLQNLQLALTDFVPAAPRNAETGPLDANDLHVEDIATDAEPGSISCSSGGKLAGGLKTEADGGSNSGAASNLSAGEVQNFNDIVAMLDDADDERCKNLEAQLEALDVSFESLHKSRASNAKFREARIYFLEKTIDDMLDCCSSLQE